jgi:2'-5' RNA ligase
MNLPASVEGRERLRLFCALRLSEGAIDALRTWQEAVFTGVEGIRMLAREQLHVTLAFLGGRPRDDLEPIAAALAEAAGGVAVPTLSVHGYRETRSVGMLTCADEGGRAAALATDLHERLERLGVYERERRDWLPHVTVIRFRERPRLQPPLPELEPIVTSEAAVYMSTLRPSGAQYEVLESIAVGGS